MDILNLNDGCLAHGALQDNFATHKLEEQVLSLQAKLSSAELKIKERDIQLDKMFTVLKAYEERLGLFSDEMHMKNADIDILLNIITKLKTAKSKKDMRSILNNFSINENALSYIH